MGEFGRPDEHIGVLVADGFEDAEFSTSRSVLQQAGYRIDVIGTTPGVRVGAAGSEVSVTASIDRIDVDDYDVLVVPGGASPDVLAEDQRVIALVRHVAESDGLVGALCRGTVLLARADVVRGRRVTGDESSVDDLRDAGATVVDQGVVVDEPIVTAREPADLATFASTLIGLLSA